MYKIKNRTNKHTRSEARSTPRTANTEPPRTPRTKANVSANLVEKPHDPSDASARIWALNDHQLRAVARAPSPSHAGDEIESAILLPQSPPRPPTKEHTLPANSQKILAKAPPCIEMQGTGPHGQELTPPPRPPARGKAHRGQIGRAHV